MAKRVSPEVVRRPRAGRTPGPYLVRRGEVFFFQIRPPQGLVPGRNLPPLRVRLGIRSRGQARHEAAFLARLARAAFVAWMERGMADFRDVNIGFTLGETYEEFEGNLKAFLSDSIKSPPPPQAPAELRGIAAMQQAVLLEKELRHGAEAHPLIAGYGPTLRDEIWRRWRAGEGLEAPSPSDLGPVLAALAQALGAAPTPHMAEQVPVRPATIVPPEPAAAPVAAGEGAQLFSALADEYLEWREGAGADRGTLSTARLRLDVFIALMGDKVVTAYRPRDLQLYVNQLQWLPLEYGREGPHSAEVRALGAKAAVERNKVESCWEPLSRKTMEDGYLQIVKAVVNDAVRNHALKHPFAGARIKWPSNAKPSVSREALDDETLNRVFALGVASGYIDDALLPALSLTCSRRIGLLAFLRGSDFRKKHGVVVCRVDGISYDAQKKRWFRVPFKTEDSLAYFVMHEFWSECGFVDWAIAQGDGFIFRQIQTTKDPADALSKRVNKLLIRAGAQGRNIEVAHSFRHGSKDLMREGEIDEESLRKQMGHARGQDAHSVYGSRKEILRQECQRLARLPLPETIDWAVFRGLDWERFASKPRQKGRSKADDQPPDGTA